MKKRMFKKLDEDDILEIVLEHFQKAYGYANARGIIFGSPGEDLRLVGVSERRMIQKYLNAI